MAFCLSPSLCDTTLTFEAEFTIFNTKTINISGKTYSLLANQLKPAVIPKTQVMVEAPSLLFCHVMSLDSHLLIRILDHRRIVKLCFRSLLYEAVIILVL